MAGGHRYLLNKWKGIGTNPVSIDLDRVNVAAGGSLSLKADVPVSLAQVSGGGTFDLNGQSVQGLAQIDVAADADGAIAPMTVSAPVTLADTVAVNVTVADAAKLAPGTYPVFTATSISNYGTVTVGLNVTNPGKRQYSLHKSATAINLIVAKRGLAIWVW